MYVEVSTIMVCNQHVPDPNKHEQTPDVLGERPWSLISSGEHIVDSRERRRHSHARTNADTHAYAHTYRHMAFAHAHACMHAQTHTHTRTQTHTRSHARTHTRTHTHTHTHTHMTRTRPITHTHTRTQIHTRHTRKEVPLPACVGIVKGEAVEVERGKGMHAHMSWLAHWADVLMKQDWLCLCMHVQRIHLQKLPKIENSNLHLNT